MANCKYEPFMRRVAILTHQNSSVQMVDFVTSEAARNSFAALLRKINQQITLPEVLGTSFLHRGILNLCKEWMEFNTTYNSRNSQVAPEFEEVLELKTACTTEEDR